MNELENYLRDQRDEPLSNHQPGQQAWERLQSRLGATEQPQSFLKTRIFLLGLTFLLATLLVMLLAFPEGSVQRSNADAATSWETIRNPQNLAPVTPQQTPSAPRTSVDVAEGGRTGRTNRTKIACFLVAEDILLPHHHHFLSKR